MELKSKKGFFFSMDAFFAILIFTVILISIYGYFVNTHELRQQYFYSEDILDIFTNIKMEEFEVGNYPYVSGLYIHEDDEIRDNMDPSLTIMGQIVKLKNNNTEEALIGASTIITNLTSPLLGERYGFSFDLMGSIYESEKNITASVGRQRYVSGV